MEVPSGQLLLCNGLTSVCGCSALGCPANPEERDALDMHLDGIELNGPVEGFRMGYLARQ